jgi:protein FAM50
LGVGGDRSRRDWARVSVDDLMLVRGEIILPHVCLAASEYTRISVDQVF